MKSILLTCVSICICAAGVAAAIDGPPITDNDYRLDLRHGPVIGSAKQVAFGGAYIGYAEGIYALNSNPAGVAFRPKRSKTRFDWDWTLGVTDLKSNDFDNNGTSPPDYLGHKIRNAGILGQWGPWGVGILSNGELLTLKNDSGGESEYVLNATSVDAGRQFLEGDITVGFGLRTTLIKLKKKQFDTTLGKISGVGWNAGVVWNPDRGPLRFGAAYLSAISSIQNLNESGSNPVVVNGIIVPSEAILPAQLGIGASYQVRGAPFLTGHPWLVLGDVVIIDASQNAVGVESVLAQKKQPIGVNRTVSLRAGTELEIWPGRMRLRLGSYYEPSFFAETNGRVHVTGGFETRLFQTHIWGTYTWGLTYTIDSARDYLNQYISIGFWYL